jgi:integrase
VHVVDYGPHRSLVLRYTDPMDGRQKTKSAKTRSRPQAIKAAGKWEDDLRNGRYHAGSKMSWSDFRERYDDEVLAGLADNTARKVFGVFTAVERILSPQRLRDLTGQRLSYLQAQLRAAGIAESTIKGNLAHLAAALSWAVKVGILSVAPKIQMPKRAKGSRVMKGRPITGEEFDRMIAAVPKVVGESRAASWEHYLRGLWLSGLRLTESLALCWDRDDKLCIDLSGKRPMLRIPAELEKGNRDRLLPMSPEFAELLLATPQDQRTGYVFNPAAGRRRGERLGRITVCEIVSRIGRRAGVKVLNKPGETDATKYATAHDLRRSFGERWASRVMPTVLKELMRHESIETTLKHYVGRNAQSTADLLWEAHARASGNTLGNTAPAGGQEDAKTAANSASGTY